MAEASISDSLGIDEIPRNGSGAGDNFSTAARSDGADQLAAGRMLLAENEEDKHQQRVNFYYQVIKRQGMSGMRNLLQLQQINTAVAREQMAYKAQELQFVREERMAKFQERQMQRQEQIDGGTIVANEILGNMNPDASYKEVIQTLSADPRTRILPNLTALAYQFKNNSIDQQLVAQRQRDELETKSVILSAMQNGINVNDFIKARENSDTPVTWQDYNVENLREAVAAKNEETRIEQLNLDAAKAGAAGAGDFKTPREAAAGISAAVRGKAQAKAVDEVRLRQMQNELNINGVVTGGATPEQIEVAYVNLQNQLTPEERKAIDTYTKGESKAIADENNTAAESFRAKISAVYANADKRRKANAAKTKSSATGSSSAPTVKITSQAEYDKLPRGAKFMSGGKTYIKQ
ncbi:MAG: hypothetical protein LBK60_03375 [Verrucomicrobiales bacterium]|jgi:hypothetical protein|nr:hypothetical protein [Verrucomicrobiales bacterium]